MLSTEGAKASQMNEVQLVQLNLNEDCFQEAYVMLLGMTTFALSAAVVS